MKRTNSAKDANLRLVTSAIELEVMTELEEAVLSRGVNSRSRGASVKFSEKEREFPRVRICFAS